MPGSMYLSSRPPVVCLLGFAWCACAPAAADPAPFAEIAAETGLDFVHFNGMTGKEYFSEMMGAGVALIDYDGDGDLDVYLVQGQLLGDGETMEDARIPIEGEPPFSDRLYRNDLRWVDGEPVLKFTDVTREAGIASIPVSVFYAQPPDHRMLRFCFAKDDATLRRGAEILCGL